MGGKKHHPNKDRNVKQSAPRAGSKPASKPAPKAAATPTLAPQLDVKHQQRLLDIFSQAFSSVLASESFPTLLQEIKQALFNRDFATAFGREDYLEAYAARWGPTRALGYAAALKGLEGYLDELVTIDEDVVKEDEKTGEEGRQDETSTTSVPKRRIKMVSIGGCASEHVAFASYLHQSSLSGNLTLLDSAPWSHVTKLIQSHLTSPPQLSKYASAALKASNKALIESPQLSLDFQQEDVLQLDKDKLAGLVGTQPLLVTILFTLNELYTNGGIGKTTKFLANLGQVLPDKSLLLVLDSPGSYSEAALGKEKKRYPMQWLLDHTLLETDTNGAKWEKLESDESVWYRLPENLGYPMQLENMRYQMHLYRIQRNVTSDDETE